MSPDGKGRHGGELTMQDVRHRRFRDTPMNASRSAPARDRSIPLRHSGRRVGFTPRTLHIMDGKTKYPGGRRGVARCGRRTDTPTRLRRRD
jgi:hypothetical protein